MRDHVEIHAALGAAKLRLVRHLLQRPPKLLRRFLSSGLLDQNLQRAQVAFALNRFLKIKAQRSTPRLQARWRKFGIDPVG